jgi:hypothetical protein
VRLIPPNTSHVESAPRMTMPNGMPTAKYLFQNRLIGRPLYLPY